MKIIGLRLRKDYDIFQIKLPKKPKISKDDIGLYFICSKDNQKDIAQIVFIKESSRPKLDDVKIIREANDKDYEKILLLDSIEEEYIKKCVSQVKKHKLPMKIVGAKLTFDNNKLTFYFTAEGRIDFRDLVKDLVSTFHKLIRLEQIGPRDEAAFLGGIGPCGRRLCCQSFLHDKESISMDAVRLQNLHSVKSSKVSGVCGKLLCCLSYEVAQYQESDKKLPNIGDKIRTKEGTGIIVDKNILAGKVIVDIDGKKVEKDY